MPSDRLKVFLMTLVGLSEAERQAAIVRELADAKDYLDLQLTQLDALEAVLQEKLAWVRELNAIEALIQETQAQLHETLAQLQELGEGS
ncbi:MAG: hypothetical protein F6K42_15530 [Leptolyngbya sp. SIO1D8]|nr:hypothetical protein [Leptolyngbya sp. SIO1D8]